MSPITLVGLAFGCLFFSALASFFYSSINNKRLLFAGAVGLILSLMNSKVMWSSLGFRVPQSIVFLLLAFFTIVFTNRLRLRPFLHVIFLFVFVLLSYFSAPINFKSVQLAFDLILILVFSYVLYPAFLKPVGRESFDSVFFLIGVYSIVCSLQALTVVFGIGRDVFLDGYGGAGSTLYFGAFSISRLQNEVWNPNPIATQLSIAIVWLFAMLRNVVGIAKLLLLMFMLINLLALLWTGSRSYILATPVALLLGYMVTVGLSFKKIFLISLTSAIVVFLSFNIISGILMRGDEIDSGRSALEVFQESRLEPLIFVQEKLSFFGEGYGALLADGGKYMPRIENFWLRTFLELGGIGGLIYFSFFAFVTLVGCFGDLSTKGSARMLKGYFVSLSTLIWIASIGSFGFSIPNALMAYFIILSFAFSRRKMETISEHRNRALLC